MNTVAEETHPSEVKLLQQFIADYAFVLSDACPHVARPIKKTQETLRRALFNHRLVPLC